MDVERKLSLVEKLAKCAKCVIEPLIKLPIYKQRAFHRLNHWFTPNKTREIVFTFLTVTEPYRIVLPLTCQKHTRLNTERSEKPWKAKWSHRLLVFCHRNIFYAKKLRECLCKSSPVDFAWDTDLAHFLCVVRHSFTYSKTTIRLIGSLYFSEFYGN